MNTTFLPRMLALGVGIMSCALGARAEVRTWTSAADPAKTFQGELVSSDGVSVTIKKADGTSMKAPLDKFSPSDVTYVKEQKATADKTTAATTSGAVTAVPPDSDLGKLNLGKPVEGLPEAKKEELGGKVVMLEFWGTR
jgi:hypothetical protein